LAESPCLKPPPSTIFGPQVVAANYCTQQHQPSLQDIPAAPVYTPTAQEWTDPLAYIRSIQSEAASYGICVVKSPVAPAICPGQVLAQQGFTFSTRQQQVADRDWKKEWDQNVVFWQQGKRYTAAQFQAVADTVADRELGGLHAALPVPTVEARYWKEREGDKELTVEYGNDLEGTAFHVDDPLGRTAWNLNVRPCVMDIRICISMSVN
jgi:jmjN domain